MEEPQLKIYNYCFDLQIKHIDKISFFASLFHQDLEKYFVSFAIANYIKNYGFAINDEFKDPTLDEFGFYIELFFDEVIKEEGDKLFYEIKDSKLIVTLQGDNFNDEWLKCLCKCFKFTIENISKQNIYIIY